MEKSELEIGFLKKQDRAENSLSTHFKYKDIARLKVNGYINIWPINSDQKKSEVVALTLDKIDFRTRTITREN